METKVLTATPGDQPSRWEQGLRVELRRPCVSLDAAIAHLQVGPHNMVVRVEHGPKGGWNNAVWFNRQNFRVPPMHYRLRYSWYIVLKQLPRPAPKQQTGEQPKLFL